MECYITLPEPTQPQSSEPSDKKPTRFTSISTSRTVISGASSGDIEDGVCADNHVNCGIVGISLDMSLRAHANDSRPLLPGCQCFCCQNHSRAYIHHLVRTHEMLALVLLHMYVLQYVL